MPDQHAQLQRLIDEAAIRNAVAQFADAAATGDYVMLRSVWADDGEFIIGQAPHGQSAKGADDVGAMLRRLRTGLDYFVQLATPGAIQIERDEATTRTFYHESARGAGEHYYRNHCVAFDRLRRSGEAWVFTSPSFQYLWLDTAPFAGTGFALFLDAAAA